MTAKTADGPALAAPVGANPPPQGQPVAASSGEANAPGSPSPPPPAGRPAPPDPTAPWAPLRVGATVLAAYWNDDKEIDGWWAAIIIGMEGNEFVLKWRDTTEYRLGKVERKHIAILHPDFLASGM